MPNTDDGTLQRVRRELATAASLREVRMFGGVSFMVDDKLVVNVRRDGRLLVRVDPDHSPALVARHGARQAEMGPGRDMGPSWLDVAPDLIASDEQLRFWIGTALAHTARLPSSRTRR
jgi:TfoX/Sxy family transcriptional regulator of competence genes